MMHAAKRVTLTRRRGDAEEDAENTFEASKAERTQRKRRDVGWRVRPLAYASLRSPWISAVSALDFLDNVLRVFLRVSASPRQTDGLFGPGFAGLRSGSR